MKKPSLPFFILLFPLALSLASCGNRAASEPTVELPPGTTAVGEDLKAWENARESFHEVMSATFHPAEEGNLEPLKTKYAELADQAKAWSAVPVPAVYRDKGLEELMKKLETGSAAIAGLVENGNDEVITESIVALHDVFHEIVGLCEHN